MDPGSFLPVLGVLSLSLYFTSPTLPQPRYPPSTHCHTFPLFFIGGFVTPLDPGPATPPSLHIHGGRTFFATLVSYFAWRADALACHTAVVPRTERVDDGAQRGAGVRTRPFGAESDQLFKPCARTRIRWRVSWHTNMPRGRDLRERASRRVTLTNGLPLPSCCGAR